MAQILGGDSLDTNHTRKIYNRFAVKDMTFEQFHKELNECVDPIKMGTDLKAIMAERGLRN